MNCFFEGRTGYRYGSRLFPPLFGIRWNPESTRLHLSGWFIDVFFLGFPSLSHSLVFFPHPLPGVWWRGFRLVRSYFLFSFSVISEGHFS